MVVRESVLCGYRSFAGEDFVRRGRRRRPGEVSEQGDGIVDRFEGGACRVVDRPRPPVGMHGMAWPFESS
jgi:hypothetical protein